MVFSLSAVQLYTANLAAVFSDIPPEREDILYRERISCYSQSMPVSIARIRWSQDRDWFINLSARLLSSTTTTPLTFYSSHQ